MQLGDIDAKLTTLKSMVNGDGIPGAMEYIQTLREEHAALQNNLTLLTQEVGQKKLACIATENDQIACDEYRWVTRNSGGGRGVYDDHIRCQIKEFFIMTPTNSYHDTPLSSNEENSVLFLITPTMHAVIWFSVMASWNDY